jgi:hypothetical protein
MSSQRWIISLALAYHLIAISVAAIPPTWAMRPFRVATDQYINAGLQQQWNMFAAPMTENHYLRLDSYISGIGTRRPLTRVQQVVYPAYSPNRIRWVNDVRDKALDNLISASSAAERGARFTLLVRYFAERLRTNFLRDNEAIVRIDVWHGIAPITPPNVTSVVTLAGNDEGPTRQPFTDATFPTLMTEYREADVTWRLEYVYEP